MRRFIPKQGLFRIYEKNKFRNLLHLKLTFSELDDYTIKQMLLRDLESSRQEWERLNSSLEDNEIVIHEQEEELNNKEKELEDLDNNYSSQIEELKLILKEEKKKSHQLEIDLNSSNQKNFLFESQIKELEITRDQHKKERDAFEEKLNISNMKWIDLDKNLGIINTKHNYLHDRNKELERTKSELERKIELSRDSYEKILNEKRDLIQELEKNNSHLNNELETIVKVENRNLSEKVKDLTNDIEKKENQIIKIEGIIEESQKEAKHQSEQYEAIKEELDIAHKDLSGLRAEIRKLDKEKLELKVQLDKKINLLWNREKEVREIKVKVEQLETKNLKVVKELEEEKSIRKTLSTTFNFEREPIEVREYLCREDYRNGLHLPPNFYPPHAFVQKPYPPNYSSYIPSPFERIDNSANLMMNETYSPAKTYDRLVNKVSLVVLL